MHPAHIRRLRRGSIALILLVLAAVLFNYLQVWRSRRGVTEPAGSILGDEVARTAEKIEYTQNEGGNTRFRILADRLIETREGKNHLEGIEAFDLDPDGSIRNQIESRQAEYDGENRTILFSGDVQLRVGDQVTLLTDSLFYDLRANQGRTPDPVRFASREGKGSCRGLRYDQKAEALELLQDVRLTMRRTPESGAGEDEIHVASAQALYSGIDRAVRFMGGARLESGEDVLVGAQISAGFSPVTRRLTSLASRGHASYRSGKEMESRVLEGDEIQFVMEESLGTFRQILIRGDSRYVQASAGGKSQELTAAEMMLDMDPVTGRPTSVRSDRETRFTLRDGNVESLLTGENSEVLFGALGEGLQHLRVWGKARLLTSSPDSESADELGADEILVNFDPSGDQIRPQGIRASGSAHWQLPPVAGRGSGGRGPGWSLTAALLVMRYSESGDFLKDGTASGQVQIARGNAGAAVSGDFRLWSEVADFSFYPVNNRVRSLEAREKVRAQQFTSRGDPEGAGNPKSFTTSSQTLRAQLDEQGNILNLNQSGAVVYQDEERKATAGQSTYSNSSETLIMTERPAISDREGTTTTGTRMEYDSRSGILKVVGSVRSELHTPLGPTAAGPGANDTRPSVSIVTADLLQYDNRLAAAKYEGKVALLGTDSQLFADQLEILAGGDEVHAAGRVRHLLFDAQAVTRNAAAGERERERETRSTGPMSTEARSSILEYRRSTSQIHYGGGVVLIQGEIRLTASDFVATVGAEGKEIKEGLARGKVEIRQQDRVATGDTARYYGLPGKFVVEGNPAEIVDPARGTSSALRLTFYVSDDRIQLENK